MNRVDLSLLEGFRKILEDAAPNTVMASVGCKLALETRSASDCPTARTIRW